MGQPTTEPVLERIVVDLVDALGTIATTDPTTSYWNDVLYVYRQDVGMPQIAEYPAIVVTVVANDVSDDVDEDIHSQNTEDLILRIDGWLETETDTDKKLVRLMRDIRTAIMIDPQRADLAVHTFVEGASFNYAADLTAPRSLVEIDVRVHYATRVDQLETAV